MTVAIVYFLLRQLASPLKKNEIRSNVDIKNLVKQNTYIEVTYFVS